MNDDFSMRWFGVPDEQVVRFWKLLESLPQLPEHNPDRAQCYCGDCQMARRNDWMINHPGQMPPWKN